jgi:deoxyribonuclease V
LTGELLRIDLAKARRAQELLSRSSIDRDCFTYPPRLVGGVDVAFSRGYAIGACVVLSYEDLRVVDKAYYVSRLRVPYIPTYLAFREIPAMIGAVKRLKVRPDIMLVDAHGRLHPRKAGEATHLGVVMDIPTIGVAKSHLLGEVRDDGYVVYRGEVLGYRLETGIYVSVGHKVSLETAIKIVRRLSIYSVPEPTRQAHIYANSLKKRVGELVRGGNLLKHKS